MIKQAAICLGIALFICMFAGCIDEYSVPSPPASNIQYPVYTPSMQMSSGANTVTGEINFVFEKAFYDGTIERFPGTDNYRKLIIAYVGSTEIGRSEFDLFQGGSLSINLPYGNYVIRLRGFDVWDKYNSWESAWKRESRFMKEKNVSVLVMEAGSPEIKLWYGKGGFPLNADL